MKILSLNVQNFLRIEALEIIPNGNTVTITGKNEQGKSSTLRAIDAALGGGKAPADPVHRGANKGEIVVQLGQDKVEAIVTRTYIKRDGKEALTSVTVTTPEGARWDRPQEFLDKVLGSLSLDPVKFLGMKPEQQALMVRAFVKDYDFAVAETAHQVDYDRRTEVNREIKRLEAEVNAIPDFPEDYPREMIDTGQLIDAIERAGEANLKMQEAQHGISDVQAKIERFDIAIASNENEIADLEAKLVRAKKNLATLQADRKDASDSLEAAQSIYRTMVTVDVSDARGQLAAAESTNEKVRARKQAETRKGRLESTLEDQRKESVALTEAIEKRKVAAAEAIKKADMPVPGLGFDDDGKVTLNGFPFANVAFSKRLMAAIAIAAAHAPTLRLVKIEDGDKLDDDAKALLAQFADEHDLQVWTETVQHGKPIGFVIEDGKLKGYADGQ